MNYIELLNQFWQIRRAKGFTANEADLYYYLMNESNSRMWLNPFELATAIICAELGMSRKTLTEVRTRLKQKGLIDYTDGNKNKTKAVYELKSVLQTLACGNKQRNKQGNIQGNIQGNEQGNIDSNIQGNVQGNHIRNKLNKTKQEGESTSSPEFLKFSDWCAKHAPNVLKMKEPFTETQMNRFINEHRYSKQQLCNILTAMHNYQPLLKNNVSAYLTALKWIRRDEK